MSNYTKSTNFATKDALTSGNPLKIVKGTEINTEFDNIQTAIATKADLASPTFTGTPTLPTGTIAVTQSSGNSTTAIATTAFVQAAAALTLATAYPVGSIYTATVSTNPATLLGFGTWTAFAAGRVLIGDGGGFSAGATGGSADSIVVSHTHTATSTDSGHIHRQTRNDISGGQEQAITGVATGNAYATATGNGAAVNTQSSTANITTTIASTGSSGTNANLPPYIVVYMWTRTA
jgi:hypothetical protein